MTDHDTFPVTGPDRDEDLRPTVLRTIRHHTNPHQRGARRADLSRILGRRFGLDEPSGSDALADVLASLVDDGAVETDRHDGTVYYRLADGET